MMDIATFEEYSQNSNDSAPAPKCVSCALEDSKASPAMHVIEQWPRWSRNLKTDSSMEPEIVRHDFNLMRKPTDDATSLVFPAYRHTIVPNTGPPNYLVTQVEPQSQCTCSRVNYRKDCLVCNQDKLIIERDHFVFPTSNSRSSNVGKPNHSDIQSDSTIDKAFMRPEFYAQTLPGSRTSASILDILFSRGILSDAYLSWRNP